MAVMNVPLLYFSRGYPRMCSRGLLNVTLPTSSYLFRQSATDIRSRESIVAISLWKRQYFSVVRHTEEDTYPPVLVPAIKSGSISINGTKMTDMN